MSAVVADSVRALPFYADSCHLKYKYRCIHPKFPPDMKREVTVGEMSQKSSTWTYTRTTPLYLGVTFHGLKAGYSQGKMLMQLHKKNQGVS